MRKFLTKAIPQELLTIIYSKDRDLTQKIMRSDDNNKFTIFHTIDNNPIFPTYYFKIHHKAKLIRGFEALCYYTTRTR